MAGTNQIASETWVPQTDKFGNQTVLPPGASPAERAAFNARIQDLANRTLINSLSVDQARMLGIPVDRNGFVYGQSPADRAAFAGYTLPNSPDVAAALANWVPNVPGVTKEQAFTLLNVGDKFAPAPTVSQETMDRQLAEGKAASLLPPVTPTYSVSPGVQSAPGTGAYAAGQPTGNGFTAEQNAQLDAIQQHIENNPINPDVEINQQTLNDYLTQAKSELAPYYNQLFSQGKQDVTTGMGQINEDLAASERSLEKNYGRQLEGVQSDAANRGLTFSSIRNTNERTLADTTQEAIEAGRREAQRRALSLGTAAERQLGSSNLPDLATTSDAPTPILNRPGVGSFAKPVTSRSLFAPVGGTTGTLQQDRLAAETGRQKELAGIERQDRAINYL